MKLDTKPAGLVGRECEPGYEVTPDGRVFSTSSNWRGYGVRELAISKNSDGYASVRIHRNGKRVRKPVHVLVAIMYLGPKPSPLHQVRHLDGDRMNPRADNLAWGTSQENHDDCEMHGTVMRGERNGNSRLTTDGAATIRKLFLEGRTRREIAGVVDVSTTTVQRVINGKAWRTA